MKKGVKGIVSAAALAALLSVSSLSAFAADHDSYMSGQQRAQARNDAYAQAAVMESEEEQKAFLTEQGIGDTEWSKEAAASFSYVAGRQRGAAYRTGDSSDAETADTTAYRYAAGQQRGSSYRRTAL